MAAYAALTSVTHIIDHLQNHPSPPISLDKQQLQSLTQSVTFLQESLERSEYHVDDSEEADPMEMRIADAAHAAEDVLETEIVDQLLAQSTIHGKMVSFFKFLTSVCKCAAPGDDFYKDMQLVINEMDLIKEALTLMQTNTEISSRVESQPQIKVLTRAASVKSSSTVGFDDVLIEVLDKLTGGGPQLQIIPIMGMGGIGKTTLARNVFDNKLVREYFDICAWTTISQTYNTRETLGEVLSQVKGKSSGLDEKELGLELYQHLYGRRYLIIMDDIWGMEAWEKMKFAFPESNNGSRVIVTTRLSNMSSHLDKSQGFHMKFLDEVSSWDLFCKTVFHGKCVVPLNLEEIGKRIVGKCGGLPLSIVTIGGILTKSELTREYWHRIEGNLNSIVNTKNDEYCLKILKLSYNHLPVHLKPCFLYMGVFREDWKIRVSTLVKLWVSEGFLKPESGTSLETSAENYLKELVDRNLILVHELGSTGNIKFCKMHDLLRDLCLREGVRERFYNVIEADHDHSVESVHRRLSRFVIPGATSDERVVEALKSRSHARSVICDQYLQYEKHPMPLNFRLLRILKACDKDSYSSRNSFFLHYVFHLVNLRYLATGVGGTSEGLYWIYEYPSSINFIWNLQTLIFYHDSRVTAPIDIWGLAHLRHAKLDYGMHLSDPPSGKVVVLENLQTLKKVRDLKLNEEVLKRIPNIKKLAVIYGTDGDDYCVSNYERLQKLESFNCLSWSRRSDEFLEKLTFPRSLKKLALLFSNELDCEEMLEKIGQLPLLENLELEGVFPSGKWETVEGQFSKLKFLLLRACRGLEHWTTESSSHFPCLEVIRLHKLRELEEIPLEMGDIPTLKSILLEGCKESVVMSASMILEKREEEQLEEQLSFHVRVDAWESRKHGFKLVRCSESRKKCAAAKGRGGVFSVRSEALNENGEAMVEESDPHFHNEREVFNEVGEALAQRFAGPNFTVIV